MIKLLWNTQNHKIKKSSEQTHKDKIDYKWGIYHKKNSDQWIYTILKKINFLLIRNEQELEKDDVLIIVDSSPENKEDLYIKLKLICSKVFLIHLGDETGSYDLTKIYSHFNFVWRCFCLNKFFNNSRVRCIPIGYKSGVRFKQQKVEKKYKWAFIGTPHRSSRHDILYQFSNINPSFCYKTKAFNEKILDVDEMSMILSSTHFAPCPNGFFHPETYRLYESLECGSIPIVENAFKYYDRLFPNNPFIKVDKWIEAKSIIKEWNDNQINKKKKECQFWWNQYQNKLQEDMLCSIKS